MAYRIFHEFRGEGEISNRVYAIDRWQGHFQPSTDVVPRETWTWTAIEAPALAGVAASNSII